MGNVMNLGRLLSDTARRLPDWPSLVWGEKSWTWAETSARVDALVAALRRRGLGKGDAILVQAKNSNQMFESMWAAFRLGGIWVPTNYRLTPVEVAYLGASSGARAMLCDDSCPQHAAAVKEASDSLQHVIAIGEPRSGEEAYEDLVAEGRGETTEAADVDYDDPCWFFYTSGTTGRPKAAVLTHGQLAFVTNNHLADLMPGTTHWGDASLVVAPLSHGAGAHVLSQVARGTKSVLLAGERFDEEEIWRLVEAHRITNMFTVPTILTRMVRHPAVDRYDHASLRYVIYAGAPMYRADQKEALRKLGKVIVQYYGLGEVTGNITVLPREAHSLDDDMPVGSCGYARTGMEIAIKDGDGRRLPAGEQGEICVRGPAVFAGYHNNPEANAKALKDGWFHTGDLGRLDDEGFLYITGRASDMYISGGSNVYPREAEEVLLTHPAVAEVAVLGVPDPEWGETGVAVVVLEQGQSADAEELLGFLKDKLARYKQPRRVFFWDELPKSGYGKVPKHLIRDALYARGELTETAAQ